METKYMQNIFPKVDEIKKLCNQYKIPCFMAFGVELDEEGKYKMRGTCLLPELYDQDAKDRRFTDFVNVQNGFITMPPETNADVGYDMDDIGFDPGSWGKTEEDQE